MFVPTFEAYTVKGSNSVQTWCDYCYKWHLHGKSNGHRGAHCSIPGSPYKETGYHLKIVGPLTKTIERAHQEPEIRKVCVFCNDNISPKQPFTCALCGRTQKSTRINSFSKWLYAQVHNVNEGISDVAEDAIYDAFWPAYSNNIHVYLGHLEELGACDSAIEAFKQAWALWNKLEESASFSRYLVAEEAQKLRGVKSSLVGQRDGLKPRLRFAVLKRDGYRCLICGKTNEDGVQLEVDHIEAVANGGTDDMENLQTLCFDCNRGKHTDSM